MVKPLMFLTWLCAFLTPCSAFYHYFAPFSLEAQFWGEFIELMIVDILAIFYRSSHRYRFNTSLNYRCGGPVCSFLGQTASRGVAAPFANSWVDSFSVLLVAFLSYRLLFCPIDSFSVFSIAFLFYR